MQIRKQGNKKTEKRKLKNKELGQQVNMEIKGLGKSRKKERCNGEKRQRRK